MARDIKAMDIGDKIDLLDSESGASRLVGTAVPGGDASFQDDADDSSSYHQIGGGALWVKVASGSGADKWRRVATTDDVNAQGFRALVNTTTSESGPTDGTVRDLNASPWSDDDGTTLAGADYALNDYILFCGATKKLMQVTNIAGDSITLSDAAPALASGDNFVVQNYLPNPNNLETQAIVHYNGTDCIKLGDVQWQFATGINLSASFSATPGTVLPGDSVEAAIEKLLSSINSLVSLTGEAAGSLVHAPFPGSTIPDNSTTRDALTALESAVEAAGSLIKFDVTLTSGAGATVINSAVVDDVYKTQWDLWVLNIDTGDVRTMEVEAFHNGIPGGADATLVKESVDDKKRLGSPFNVQVKDTTLTGTGASQNMNLVMQTNVGGSGIRIIGIRKDVCL